MSEKWKLRLGREAFRQLIHKLSAFQARNVGRYEPDPPIPPFHTVTREAMLGRFLALRPDLEPFRAELADVYAVLPEFCVNSILWQQLVGRNR